MNITWGSLTKAQKRLMEEMAEAIEQSSMCICVQVYDNEERTAKALAAKGLIEYDGEAQLTELGLRFVQENFQK